PSDRHCTWRSGRRGAGRVARRCRRRPTLRRDRRPGSRRGGAPSTRRTGGSRPAGRPPRPRSVPRAPGLAPAERRPFRTQSRRRSNPRPRARSAGRGRPGGSAAASGPRTAASSPPSSRPTCQGTTRRRPTIRTSACRSFLGVLIVAAPPEAGLVAPFGGAVEPLVHAPQAVHAARIGRIGVVDDAVLERERAQALSLTYERRPVGAGSGCDLGGRPLLAGLQQRLLVLGAEVVFHDVRPRLLLSPRRLQVVAEIVSGGRRPGEPPPHPPLVRLQLRERRPRDRRKRDVVIRQVDDGAVEAIRDRRTRRTPRLIVGPEHEVIDEELRAPPEEVGQRGAALVGIELVLLVDPDPRQLLPAPRQLVAAVRQLFLRLEQLEPGSKPLFTCPRLMLRHRCSPPPES